MIAYQNIIIIKAIIEMSTVNSETKFSVSSQSHFAETQAQ